MIYRKVGNLHLYTFENLEEYLDRAENPRWKIASPRYESGWGTEKHQQQMRLARVGFGSVTTDIDRYRDMLVTDISQKLPKPQQGFDKIGSFWDLDRVIENDPDCWHTEYPSDELGEDGRGKFVRLVINTAASHGVRDRAHAIRCAAVLALCQLLEQSGYMVQFEITTAISVNRRKLEFRTIAKRPHEAFNTGALSYWCSANFEKYADFAICETLAECVISSPKRKGLPLVMKTDAQQPYWQVNLQQFHYGRPLFTHDPGDICFDRNSTEDANWSNPANARAYLVKILNRQGIYLKDQKEKAANAS